jgi:squalene synthase HpnC
VDDDDANSVESVCVDHEAVLADLASQAAAQSGSENFPVALRVLPQPARSHLARVYAFARFVDDVGDEAPGNRVDLLNMIEKDVEALWGGEPMLGPVAELRPVIDACAVPIEPLLDLIEANRVDQRVAAYETFDDLLAYCQLSAAPVGRLVLHIADAVTTSNLADSDSVCAALQVLEHCQDVGEDARAGRVYLPASDLRAGGVEVDNLLSTITTPQLRKVIAVQVARAQGLLESGRPLVRRLSGWAKFAVAGYAAGGAATATALRQRDYEVLGQEIRPSRARTAMHMTRLLTRW